jgi:SAM-dependent methyltransferase
MTSKLSASRILHGKLVFPRRVATLGKSIAPLLPAGRVLDIGCGDGSISHFILSLRPDIAIQGVDVLLRPESKIPVQKFDGIRLPFPDKSFDAVLFVDVLHHTDDPGVLIREAARVARSCIVIKDHTRDGLLSEQTLRFMDWFGNAHHGVVLPYNYWPKHRWSDEFAAQGLQVKSWVAKLGLYSLPFSLLFERKLHFIAVLSA